MSPATSFRVISRDELKERLGKGPAFKLWDTRIKEYFTPEETIAGATWVAAPDIGAHVASTQVNKADEIVVFCASTTCPASRMAAEQLVALGYTNVSAYEGGLKEWKEGGLPVAAAK